MRSALILVLVAIVVAVRLTLRRRRRAGAAGREPVARSHREGARGPVAMVAGREITTRLKGRVFRVATILILLVVGAAIVIPTLHKGKVFHARVGVVAPTSAVMTSAIAHGAVSVGDKVSFVDEPSLAAAQTALRSGHLDAILDGTSRFLVDAPVSSTSTSSLDQFVTAAAAYAGFARSMIAAGLSDGQITSIAGARALAIDSLIPGKGSGKGLNGPNATSIFGLILIFIMLSQYNGWILVGVMEEKSSRVIEVLLAAVRPIQLMTGKVMGIGAVAFTQGGIIVAFALIVAKAVGSNLLHGTQPLVLVGTLAWLFLGYGFYCWVYAAAGSMVERQDQAQTLAFPLSLPLIFGYVFSLTEASSSSASTFFKVLAYLPPTAPFAMPTLLGLHEASWWQFFLSVAIDLVATYGVARGAAYVYRRAILRTGGRVKLRDLTERHAAVTA
ncbi:MAG TPA: ABC transporter permease [Acidimicrobiales bacterium]|nr:ABC transporter permease [Acidimicrobiales bacterium]